MKKNKFELNEEICEIFNLEWYQVWLFSNIFYLPTVEEVKKMLEETHAENAQYRR